MEHRSFCRICMAHCGVIVTTDGDEVVKVSRDPDHVFSRGYVCPKGRMLGALHHHPERFDYPMLRIEGELQRVSWEQLLDDLAAKLRVILDESGPDAIGDYRGTAYGMDGASRWVHAALGAAFGPANRYSPMTIDCAAKNFVAELVGGRTWLVPIVVHEHVSLLVIVGSNPVVSHGQFAQFADPVSRLREIAEHAEIWVVDPRRPRPRGSRIITSRRDPAPTTQRSRTWCARSFATAAMPITSETTRRATPRAGRRRGARGQCDRVVEMGSRSHHRHTRAAGTVVLASLARPCSRASARTGESRAVVGAAQPARTAGAVGSVPVCRDGR